MTSTDIILGFRKNDFNLDILFLEIKRYIYSHKSKLIVPSINGLRNRLSRKEEYLQFNKISRIKHRKLDNSKICFTKPLFNSEKYKRKLMQGINVAGRKRLH